MSHLSRRAVLAGLSAFAAMPALAKDWPERSITLIHGFPPGGPADTLSRIIAEGLARHLGQPVVVEAKPGATGTTAGGLVARAQPDGYTLMYLPSTYPTTAAFLRSLPYRPIDDFSFISTTSESPLVLVTHPDSGIDTFADFIAAARSRGAPLLYGTAGVGSLMHLAMELLALKAEIKLQHVPYQGGMPALTDLLGKRIDVVIDPPTSLVEFVRSRKLRAIAITGAQRFEALPAVPTVSEAGLSGYDVMGYSGIVAPRGLPENILNKIDGAITSILSEPGIIKKFGDIGQDPKTMAPAAFRSRVAADIEQWKRVVDAAHIALN